LEKIIFNLLSNAFKYTSEGESAQLDVSLESEKLKIIVTNTGSGIKLEDQQLIFDRFTILDRVESQILQGLEARTGIGLALCKDLIDLLHGSISVKSQPKEYASFEVLLPFLEVSDLPKEQLKTQQLLSDFDDNIVESEIEIEKDNKQDSHDSSQKQTVLVIDDESKTIEIFAMNGQIVWKNNNVILNTNINPSIDRGIYIVKVITESNLILYEKLIRY